MKKLISAATVGVISLAMSVNVFAYTVKPGDTLYHISVVNKVSVSTIMEMNPMIKNAGSIQVGQFISLPGDLFIPSSQLTDENELLARIVASEAAGETFEGKVAVADVILNRVTSPLYPNTIKDVIYQPGQFGPVTDGSLEYKNATDQDRQAVAQALQDERTNVLFYYNPSKSNSTFFSSRTVAYMIGNHTFLY
ncbi:cell wall hydrolase [Neobacillus pocheonensis]|uniref:Cell wall hydrolase n=1 Tax=Neobacillus pocheonensis TaxID=363869 RepID=A0ABT0WGJ0_9BACI|nr:cell wall hydrolase [Neobacillus pocheonensis]